MNDFNDFDTLLERHNKAVSEANISNKSRRVRRAGNGRNKHRHRHV